MKPGNQNSYKSLKSISIDDKNYKYYSLAEADKGLIEFGSLFFSFTASLIAAKSATAGIPV